MATTTTQTILITGGAGFIGSHAVAYMLEHNPHWNIVNLDLLTYASDRSYLAKLENHPRYHFVHGDICDASLVSKLFQTHDIRGVIHLAAESHVDNSISGPAIFIKTNIEGTHNLLQHAKNHWFQAPFHPKPSYQDCRFLHVSTDEVYGSLTLDDPAKFTELTRYAPSSPYSASKASADMLVRSYHQTYGLNTTITACSNNYGPHQHSEKLIPTIIRNALNHQPIPIYGDGKNIRDWLHVLDHCHALNLAYHHGKPGETYNIGGNNEIDNLSLAYTICGLLDKHAPSDQIKSYKHLVTLAPDRPGHDRRYAIDSTKIHHELGWQPTQDFEATLLTTIHWYLKKFSTTP